MIFGSDYDTSLWCIVKADRKNRKEIYDIIKEIPDQLLENIRMVITKIENGEVNLYEERPDFDICISKKNPRFYYYFQIARDRCLIITKAIHDGVNDYDLFELMLYPVSLEDIYELENFEEEWLGTVTNNIKETPINGKFGLIDCNESEYNIYKTPIGYFIGYPREILQGEKEIVIFKPIGLRRMPNDINKDNISCKRLVFNKNSRNK